MPKRLSAAQLRELLDYDPDTGALTWRNDTRWTRRGARAGGLNPSGARHVKIDRQVYLEHRLAWLHVHGVWPSHEIDHINRVRDDNRIVNLRDVTRAENQQNRSATAHNSTGIKGVWYDATKERFRAKIKHLGRTAYLGYFQDVESARAAYAQAAKKYHRYNPSAAA